MACPGLLIDKHFEAAVQAIRNINVAEVEKVVTGDQILEHKSKHTVICLAEGKRLPQFAAGSELVKQKKKPRRISVRAETEAEVRKEVVLVERRKG